jgi:hypothetical protein
MARCPDCDTLQEIVPNGADPTKTTRRARLVLHKNPKATMARDELCLGSGRDI